MTVRRFKRDDAEDRVSDVVLDPDGPWVLYVDHAAEVDDQVRAARRERNRLAASTLGGFVEGAPTSEVNWLQRARALVRKEAALEAANARLRGLVRLARPWVEDERHSLLGDHHTVDAIADPVIQHTVREADILLAKIDAALEDADAGGDDV